MASSVCLPQAPPFSFPIPPSASLFTPSIIPKTPLDLHTSPTPLRPWRRRPSGHPKISFTTTRNRTRATLDDQRLSLVVEDQNPGPNKEVEECVRVLKDAAKTRKVPPEEILQAFSVIEKAKLDPSGYLQTLGGTQSPGRTWMLIFTAQKKLDRGNYFPITAVQRFDAAGQRIENGVYLGPLGNLTFEGRFSWNKRILAFIFERIRVKIGPLGPFEYCFKGKDDDEREPSTKDPFFIWFYVDEEIAVARGRSGGTAFWVRCQRI